MRERWEAFLDWLLLLWYALILGMEWGIDRIRQWMRRG